MSKRCCPNSLSARASRWSASRPLDGEAASPVDVDVAIVGGGPAGAAAALTLRRYTGRSVVLIERSSYGELRIGETVSNALKPLLAYLGVSQVSSLESIELKVSERRRRGEARLHPFDTR